MQGQAPRRDLSLVDINLISGLRIRVVSACCLFLLLLLLLLLLRTIKSK